MKALAEIKEILEKHREELRQKYKMRVVGIFGSYVRGEHKRGSDIDLLGEFEEPVSLLELVGAEIYLSEILKMKVDLIPKEDIRPELKETILKETLHL
ncbi:MAG: nucleotidyltransferase family protein [bacterium]